MRYTLGQPCPSSNGLGARLEERTAFNSASAAAIGQRADVGILDNGRLPLLAWCFMGEFGVVGEVGVHVHSLQNDFFGLF